MGRIKTFVLLGAALSTVLMLSGCGNTLLADVESRVSAAKSITIDFNYTGAFEVSDNFPIIFRFYPNPYSGDYQTGETIRNIKFTKQGTVVIPDSSFYPTDSKKYSVVIFHDLNNNGIKDGIEDVAYYVNDGDTNISYGLTDDDIIESVQDPLYLNFADDALMTIGKSYSVSFADEQDYIDEWESDDSYLSTNCDVLHPGESSGHWLGWEDVDYIKLSGLTDSNEYNITITEFNSNYPTLNVSLLNDSGGGLTSLDPDNEFDSFPSSPITHTYNSSDGQWYLKVRSQDPYGHGIGNYTVSLN